MASYFITLTGCTIPTGSYDAETLDLSLADAYQKCLADPNIVSFVRQTDTIDVATTWFKKDGLRIVTQEQSNIVYIQQYAMETFSVTTPGFSLLQTSTNMKYKMDETYYRPYQEMGLDGKEFIVCQHDYGTCECCQDPKTKPINYCDTNNGIAAEGAHECMVQVTLPFDPTPQFRPACISETCRVADGVAMSIIGVNKAVGKSGPIVGIDWNAIPSIGAHHNYETGWIISTYGYDFTNFTFDEKMPELNTWLDNFSVLADNYSTYITVSHHIYALSYEFYNSIYYQNTFNPKTSFSSPFDNVDLTTPTGRDNYISDRVNMLPLDSNLTKIYNSVCKFPVPSSVPSTTSSNIYQLTMNVSYKIYTELIENRIGNSSNHDVEVSTLLNSFFRDNQGSMLDKTTGIEQTIGQISVGNTLIGSMNALNLQTMKPDVVDPATYGAGKYPYHVPMNVSITVTINNWTPMLLVYFLTWSGTNKPDMTSDNICQIMSQDTNLITKDCFDKQPFTTTLYKTFCKYNYQPPNYTGIASINNSGLLTSYDKFCGCLSEGVSPVHSSNTLAGECFSMSCATPELIEKLNLTNQTCQPFCSIVTSWMTNVDKTQQPRNPADFSSQRYEQICGGSLNPLTPSQYNTKFITTAIPVAIMAAMTVFALVKHRNYQTSTAVIIAIASLCLMGYGIYDLSMLLAGFPVCNGNKFECRSVQANKNNDVLVLPDSFCDRILACECYFGGPACPDGCSCQSNVCYPKNGIRPIKEYSARRINWALFISGLLSGILFPLLLWYLHDDYHWPISKRTFLIIVFTIGAVIIAYTLYSNLKKETMHEYAAPCNGSQNAPTTCNTNSDCQSGQICQDGQCTSLNPQPKCAQRGMICESGKDCCSLFCNGGNCW